MSLLTTAPLAFGSEKFNAADLPRILEKPLIIGASVSADYATQSPSKRLALRYTTKDNIQMHAFGGRPGRDTLATLNLKTLDDRTAVLGMDLFFWDSTLADPKASIEALDKLLKVVKEKDIPIVLGGIPALLPARQPQLRILNAAIHKACQEYSKCYVMPFVDLLNQVVRNRYLEIKGRRYTFKELVPDGLHIGQEASEYLADMMRDLILKK